MWLCIGDRSNVEIEADSSLMRTPTLWKWEMIESVHHYIGKVLQIHFVAFW
jgi:hypothetical protein